jgi:hypothetical protein
MTHDTALKHVAQDESLDQSQAVALLEQYCQSVVPAHRAPGHPPEISWVHYGLGIVLCFLQGWHHQRDLWRLLGWQVVGPFAPVP